MNDNRLMQLLREADPARESVTGVQEAGDALLEEIVASAPVDPRALARLRKQRRIRQLTLRSRLLVPVIGAAAIGIAVAIPAVLHEQPTAPGVTAPSQTPESDASLPVTKVRYAAAAVRVAKANPRLLVTADGWRVRSVGGFSPTSGEMTFQLGGDRWVYSELDADGNELSSTPVKSPDAASQIASKDAVSAVVDNQAPRISVDWYPRADYSGFRVDRAKASPVAAAEVLGERRDVISYGNDDHAFLLPPQGDVFIEVRGQHLDRARFLAIVNDHSARVSVSEWLAAMPAEIVTARNAQSRLRRVLADVPTPPGFKAEGLGEQTALDNYQFGAAVAGQVVCGWVGQWQNARKAGDRKAVVAAAGALATSRDWKFLKAMDAQGDYPEVVWEIADQVAAGESPEGYRGALGCSGM